MALVAKVVLQPLSQYINRFSGYTTDTSTPSLDIHHPIWQCRECGQEKGQRIVTEQERCDWGYNKEMDALLQNDTYHDVMRDGYTLVFKRRDYEKEKEEAKNHIALSVFAYIPDDPYVPDSLFNSGPIFSYSTNLYPYPDCSSRELVGDPMDTRQTFGPVS